VLPPGAGWERGPDGSPFWKTPTGKDTARRIEFFRLLPRFGVGKMHTAHMGAFNALLESYVVDQNKEHLARWCEYVDDWALNSRRDREACPYGIRQATELEAQELRGILTLLRVALDERPEFARDFSAPTLARFLLQIVTEYAPYSIRMRRAEQANWGIMSICHLENVARFLNEFKAMSYFNREAWRLWMSNMIQHRTMDGENLEAWDEGHNYVDIVYAFPSVPCAALPPVATPADQTLFWDHLRMNMRSMLTHFSPDGDYWPSWLPYTGIRNSALMFRYLTPNREMGGKLPVCLIQNEPEARKRIETVANLGKPIEATLPSRTSDIAPYAAMFYLRESWMPGANYLMLHNFITRSQDQHIRYAPGETQGGSGRTMYELTSGASMVLGASPIFVDRKPDNRHFNGVRTGGKTTYCTQAGRNVVTTRFHTSRAFDLAEALQDAPYCNARHTDRGDFYGVYTLNLSKDNTPVTDVKALRQVMNVRGEGIYLVADRIENTGTASHEYSKFFTLPAKVREKGIADRVRVLAAEGNNLVEVDPAQRRMRTTNVGYENVTVHLFGQDFIFANALDANKEYKPLVKSQLQLIQEAVAKKQRYADIVASAGKRPVSAHWTGAGNQAMATLVYVRPAADTLAASVASDLKSCQPLPGPQGVTGCEAVTRTGARVWFQTGPARINRLQCGALAAEAETLLVVQKAGAQELSGMVLGCKTLSLNGKDLTLSRPDFEFAFASPSEPKLTLAEPIHRPIDTVRISPEQNVFTDSIEVSFEIPTQQTEDIEFRYTLDGSDPTLSSTRYNGPFELAATSFVKVRPFRKGLKETPWEMPGVDAGLTVGAVFRKEAPRPAQPAGESKPGLNYDYFEGDWPSLFTYAGIDGVLEPKAKGEVKGLLEPAETAALRKTSGAYAIRYLGRVRIPRSGVYSFYAPEHLYTTTMDAGYDLRVFIDGEEWFPTPELHSENIWHIPLETGEHTIKVAFADYRTKPFRDEFWMCWKEEEMWQGIPKLEISGPGIGKQPLPSTWLFH